MDDPQKYNTEDEIIHFSQCTTTEVKDGEYCREHLHLLKQLVVRESLMEGAGRGLFSTTIHFEGDSDFESIGPYTGENFRSGTVGLAAVALLEDNLNETGSMYTLDANAHLPADMVGSFMHDTDWLIDASRRNAHPTRLVCDPAGSVLENNAFMSANTPTDCYVAAQAFIAPGHEILMPYSEPFWRV